MSQVQPSTMLSNCSPIKPFTDYRNYRVICLENGIKTLLISDIKDETSVVKEETKLAAGALCINTGNFDDPIEIQGLAHFLEHMVFMGSEKYPNENEFDIFLNSHGGSMNASTGNEATVFHFEVEPEHLNESLDRFAQFFISPLLRENAMKRELKAVDNEFKEDFPCDNSRTIQLFSHLSCKDHPYSKFSWGNKKTLLDTPKEMNINVIDYLKVFFNDYYCKSEMTLAICSTDSLDSLENMARKHFSTIKARPSVRLKMKPYNSPFDMSKFNKLIYVSPVKEVHKLLLTWNIPSQSFHYKCKPSDYVSHIIGDERKGSIYSFLRKKGYLIDLCAYTQSWSMFGLFNCEIELTEKGLDHIEEVVQTVFQSIEMLRRNGPSKQIFDINQQIQQYCFNYLEQDDPMDYVETLVHNMMNFEVNDYLCGNILTYDYRPELIEEVLNCLQKEKVNIMISSKRYSELCDQIEPWFATKYHIKDIPSSWIDQEKCSEVNNDIFLPEQNRFIVDNFELKIANNHVDVPVMLTDTDSGRVWFKPDFKFMLPKARIYLKLVSAVTSTVEFYFVCADMFNELLKYHLNELIYEAELALFGIELDVNEELSRTLVFNGFNQKLTKLFQNVITGVKEFSFTDNQFEMAKEEMKRQYKNALLETDHFMHTLRLYILVDKNKNPIESLKILKELTSDQMKQHVTEVMQQMYVESLYQGNLLKEEVEDLQSFIYSTLKFNHLPRSEFVKLRSLELPLGRSLCRHYGFNNTDPNSSIMVYFQIGPISLRLYAIASIVKVIMDEPLFDILRTQQQLGYTIYCSVHETNSILGYSIAVHTEANKFSPDHVDKKIMEFVSTFFMKLKDMSHEEYNDYINSYVKHLKQADLSLNDECRRNWREIFNSNYIFDRRQRLISISEKLTKDDIQKFVKDFMLDEEGVRALCIQVVGHADKEIIENESSEEEFYSDTSDFSSSECESEQSEECESEQSGESEKSHQSYIKEYLDFELKLIPSECERYQRCIKNIDIFKNSYRLFSVSTATEDIF
ncbi:nardilysin isoform X1 [Hydra vulgaris]|uniref:nardilysin isoform X1 n=2 Tax=Hydra vulgaris TaxID=6087 RepID=UPI0032EA03A8